MWQFLPLSEVSGLIWSSRPSVCDRAELDPTVRNGSQLFEAFSENGSALTVPESSLRVPKPIAG